MRRSLGEIETTVRKAALASGVPTGLADDVARAAKWLIAHGFAGDAAALAAFGGELVCPQLPRRIGDELVFEDACVAICGASALDLLAALPDQTSIRLIRPDSPLLMAGLAAVAAVERGSATVLDFDGAEMSATPNGVFGGEIPGKAAEIRLSRAVGAEETSGGGQKAQEEPEVTEEIWERLSRLAAQTLVPASEHSRSSGAGAGTIDND